ncbi:hypothetical protein MBLNU459_g1364t1 [Dothideomycetes sp. NU459]
MMTMTLGSGSVSNTGRSRSAAASTIGEGARSPPCLNNDSRSTAEQRKARKREQDRLCQRRKREKDRENLRKLEARLDGLQKSDEPKVVLDMLLQREKDQAKIERQAERLRQIESLLRAGMDDLIEHASPPGSDKGDAKEEQPADNGMLLAGFAELDSGTHVPFTTGAGTNAAMTVGVMPAAFANTQQSAQLFDTTPAMSMNNGTALGPRLDTYLPQANVMESNAPFAALPYFGTAIDDGPWAQHPQQPQLPEVDFSPANGDRTETWLGTLNSMQRMQLARADLSPALVEQHILISIVLRGWDYAAANFDLDPLWLCLRKLDETVLTNLRWRNVERVVSLLMAYTLKGDALHQMTPVYLRPRPSQLAIAHPPNGDYFPWPGVRERFVFDNAKYSHDDFQDILGGSTCFLWPFNFSDMFTHNAKTQLYQFSDELIARFDNVSCWTVDSAFLTQYPEFMGDMPTFNSVPPTINDKPCRELLNVSGEGVDSTTQYQGDIAAENHNPSALAINTQKWSYNGRGFVEAAVL